MEIHAEGQKQTRGTRHLLSCPIRMRLGAVPVSVAVPPMLAAYGMQIRKPFQICIWYWASSRTSSAVRPSPCSAPSCLWGGRDALVCLFVCLFVHQCLRSGHSMTFDRVMAASLVLTLRWTESVSPKEGTGRAASSCWTGLTGTTERGNHQTTD